MLVIRKGLQGAAKFRGWASTAKSVQFEDALLEAKPRDQQYVDRLKITARAGDGGNGCVSFWRSAAKGKHVPADGGSGACGGSVILRASSNMKSLAGVQQLYKAERGGHGSKQKQHGRVGRDAVVLVPVGTVVWRQRGPEPDSLQGSAGGDGAARPEMPPAWLQQWQQPWVGADDYSSGEEEDAEEEEPGTRADAVSGACRATAAAATGSSRSIGGRDDGESSEFEVIADLARDGQEVVAARGGAGGRGNAAMRALPRRPAPATAEKGVPGDVARMLLELKLLADVALVGLPNVGKSSLLRALSAATPRVAAYSFTTLMPQLGAVEGGLEEGDKFVVADVPGLIEGSHANRGLGHRFLRHVERTRALAFVVDLAGGRPGGSTPLRPWQQLALLRSEVGHYSPALLLRPWLVVANKVDLLARPAATLAALQRRCAEEGGGTVEVVAVSATGWGGGGGPQGLPALVEEMRALVRGGVE